MKYIQNNYKKRYSISYSFRFIKNKIICANPSGHALSLPIFSDCFFSESLNVNNQKNFHYNRFCNLDSKKSTLYLHRYIS